MKSSVKAQPSAAEREAKEAVQQAIYALRLAKKAGEKAGYGDQFMAAPTEAQAATIHVLSAYLR
ncbi:hypothetical protein SRS16CHR_02700 [Variovorax sp. SRS16]|nr:hypothetical protein SRS16CHR_02700 [Variovorax sp. SRS16]